MASFSTPKTPGKRKAETPATPKRIVLSIEEKRGVLLEFDKLPPMSQECAAKILKIPRMTLRNILKNTKKTKKVDLTGEFLDLTCGQDY